MTGENVRGTDGTSHEGGNLTVGSSPGLNLLLSWLMSTEQTSRGKRASSVRCPAVPTLRQPFGTGLVSLRGIITFATKAVSCSVSERDKTSKQVCEKSEWLRTSLERARGVSK